MAHRMDSTDDLLEQEAIAHERRCRERELRIHLGDGWPLIEAKLRESEQYVDARMDALVERIAKVEAMNGPAVNAALEVLELKRILRAQGRLR